MKAMTLRTKITLLRKQEAYGHGSEKNILARREVFGSVKAPGLSFQSAAQAAGMRADLTVHLWRKDYEREKYTHAVVDDTEYRISAAGASVNDLYVRLSLERGV